MNVLGVPFERFNSPPLEIKVLNLIISVCQKEIVMYQTVPSKRGRVEMAKEIMDIIKNDI
tara:strand:+ start:220 stop:399 length:180 start_codon:yes stop_codon:yes gene_type:complete